MSESARELKLQGTLAQIEKDRLEAKDQLDRERLIRVTGDLIETITSPIFIERMRKARLAADEGAGMDVAAKLLSIDGLREAGVDIPKDFRMTSRVFEDRAEGVLFEIREPSVIDPLGDSLLWGVCGGAGGLTFCGCGGFST